MAKLIMLMSMKLCLLVLMFRALAYFYEIVITLFGCDQTSYVYKILHETQDPTARLPGGRVR